MAITSVQTLVNSQIPSTDPQQPVQQQQQQLTTGPQLTASQPATQNGAIQIPPSEPPLVQALVAVVNALVQLVEQNPSALSSLNALGSNQTGGGNSTIQQSGGGGDNGGGGFAVQQPTSLLQQPGDAGDGVGLDSAGNGGSGSGNTGSGSLINSGSNAGAGVTPGSFGTPPQAPTDVSNAGLAKITTKDGYTAEQAYTDMKRIQAQGELVKCTDDQLRQMAAGIVQGVNTYMPNASNPKGACQWLEAETWAESSFDPQGTSPNSQGQNLGPLQVANAFEGNFLQKAGIPNNAQVLTDPYWGIMAGIASIAQQRDGSSSRGNLPTSQYNPSTLGGAAYWYNGNEAQVNAYIQNIQSVLNNNNFGNLSGITF